MKPVATVTIRDTKRPCQFITMEVSEYIQFIREQAKIIGVDMGITKDKTAMSHGSDSIITHTIIQDVIEFEKQMQSINDLMKNMGSGGGLSL